MTWRIEVSEEGRAGSLVNGAEYRSHEEDNTNCLADGAEYRSHDACRSDHGDNLGC